MITFTKEQLSEVMCKHAEKENGLHDLLEIMLESLMVAMYSGRYPFSVPVIPVHFFAGKTDILLRT